MYHTAPASFILSQEVDPGHDVIPATVPNDFVDWDAYLLQVCNAQLSSVLEKEKIQLDQEVSGSGDRFKPKISGHFEKLSWKIYRHSQCATKTSSIPKMYHWAEEDK